MLLLMLSNSRGAPVCRLAVDALHIAQCDCANTAQRVVCELYGVVAGRDTRRIFLQAKKIAPQRPASQTAAG
jgi:hypothetical protein